MKLRKLISLLLSICMAVSAVFVASINTFADDTIYTSQDGLWKYRILDDGTAEIYNVDMYGNYIQAYLGDETNVVIPDSIDGLIVSTIGNWAFYENTNTVTVTIGRNISRINGVPFFLCVELTDIIVDSQNDSFCSVDGVLFNKSMTSLICYPSGKISSSYTIPEGVKTIEMDSFLLASKLESVYLSNTVEMIIDEAFIGCENISCIELNSGLQSIGVGAFYMCASLSEISIPSSVIEIGDMAFEETSLTLINGYLGTVAETFAADNGYEFYPLDPAVFGDIDTDGDVLVNDYLMLKQYIAGELIVDLTAFQKKCADVDGDGAVDAFDLFYLDKMLNSQL